MVLLTVQPAVRTSNPHRQVSITTAESANPATVTNARANPGDVNRRSNGPREYNTAPGPCPRTRAPRDPFSCIATSHATPVQSVPFLRSASIPSDHCNPPMLPSSPRSSLPRHSAPFRIEFRPKSAKFLQFYSHLRIQITPESPRLLAFFRNFSAFFAIFREFWGFCGVFRGLEDFWGLGFWNLAMGMRI